MLTGRLDRSSNFKEAMFLLFEGGCFMRKLYFVILVIGASIKSLALPQSRSISLNDYRLDQTDVNCYNRETYSLPQCIRLSCQKQ